MDEPTLWHGTAKNPIGLWIAALLLVIAIMAGVGREPVVALIAVFGLAITIPYIRLSMTITPTLVIVRMGPWGWPVKRHVIADMEWVEHTSVSRGRVRLGIGTHGSTNKLPGIAVLLRPGDAVRFQGSNGVRHTITVDGALGAVAVLDQMVETRRDHHEP